MDGWAGASDTYVSLQSDKAEKALVPSLKVLNTSGIRFNPEMIQGESASLLSPEPYNSMEESKGPIQAQSFTSLLTEGERP